jgi:hypothetical protein
MLVSIGFELRLYLDKHKQHDADIRVGIQDDKRVDAVVFVKRPQNFGIPLAKSDERK